jgi:hypothetical protein
MGAGMRALICGWFSFDHMGASAGDLFVRDVIGSWLEEIGCPYEVAMSSRLGGGVDWEQVDPTRYTHLIFACGPLGAGEPALSLFARFAHTKLIGVNLSMLDPLDEWNPFALLLERDSSRAVRPDLALLATEPPVPLVGQILVHEQKEYRDGRHAAVHKLIRDCLAETDAAVVQIDTCLDPPNTTGLRTAAQIESMIARMDYVVTTRLHGLVLALKNGVPAVAIDPIAGGAKIVRQAQALGWPYCLTPDTLSAETLRQALKAVAVPAARRLALECRDRAIVAHNDSRRRFVAASER